MGIGRSAVVVAHFRDFVSQCVVLIPRPAVLRIVETELVKDGLVVEPHLLVCTDRDAVIYAVKADETFAGIFAKEVFHIDVILCDQIRQIQCKALLYTGRGLCAGDDAEIHFTAAHRNDIQCAFLVRAARVRQDANIDFNVVFFKDLIPYGVGLFGGLPCVIGNRNWLPRFCCVISLLSRRRVIGA